MFRGVKGDCFVFFESVDALDGSLKRLGFGVLFWLVIWFLGINTK